MNRSASIRAAQRRHRQWPALLGLLGALALPGPQGAAAAGPARQSPQPVAAALPLAASTAAAAPRKAGAAVLRVPPLHFTQRKLANGLGVIALPDSGSSTVSVHVWYRVGGKDDPPGRSGFAHLFEHMMFKSTRHMQSEQFDRLTEDVGGFNNAFTADDVTAYHSTVPANHLERLLWAEAERMSGLMVDEANFKSERAVVQEEFRQRVLADPYGRLFNALAPYSFEVHPYKRPVIGSIEDLDAATLDDVRRFHATYYRPDNAVLIVAGDFDPAQLDAWVNRYFGAIEAPAAPVPRVTAKEPPRTENRAALLHGPNVPLPAVALLWQGPAAASADAAALQVAAALLSAGESARLNEALVYRQRVAQSAGFDVSLRADAGVLTAYAIAAGATPPEALVGPLLQEIERLARGPVPAAELDKVKTQMLTSELSARQTPSGRATSVGWAVILRGDATAANRELDELQAVTAADVQRVLKQYVQGGKRVTLTYTQAPSPAATPSAAPASAQESKP
jgi:zinc protease